MEQRVFLRELTTSTLNNTKTSLVRVKRSYANNQTMLIEKGEEVELHYDRKKRITFLVSDQQEPGIMCVVVTPAAVMELQNVVRLKNINWQRDSEAVILRKLANPYLTIEASKHLEMKINQTLDQITSLKSRITGLEEQVASIVATNKCV